MSEPKKGGLPNHAQLVSEVRKLAQRVTELEAKAAASEVIATGSGAGLTVKWDESAPQLAAVATNSALCPGCGEIVGECADTCAYERKHAVRVERYGSDAA